eukprot:TRINITY_DN4242_c0_g1_i2.p4 TRINITY_DN4242_c0_g1~~TRINITY_DN4242_c0_g1_i2.p4  ORF type:complete len:135 (+),score=41.82 TRINITY_DN4242_c0_g1_i2:1040-1444(+)
MQMLTSENRVLQEQLAYFRGFVMHSVANGNVNQFSTAAAAASFSASPPTDTQQQAGAVTGTTPSYVSPLETPMLMSAFDACIMPGASTGVPSPLDLTPPSPLPPGCIDACPPSDPLAQPLPQQPPQLPDNSPVS